MTDPPDNADDYAGARAALAVLDSIIDTFDNEEPPWDVDHARQLAATLIEEHGADGVVTLAIVASDMLNSALDCAALAQEIERADHELLQKEPHQSAVGLATYRRRADLLRQSSGWYRDRSHDDDEDDRPTRLRVIRDKDQ
jgi:hypothetical protein